eukprot:873985-Amphidinium_carterae.1
MRMHMCFGSEAIWLNMWRAKPQLPDAYGDEQRPPVECPENAGEGGLDESLADLSLFDEGELQVLLVLVAKPCCILHSAGAPMDSPLVDAADVQAEAQMRAEGEPQTSEDRVKGGHSQTRKLPRVAA